MRSTFDGGSQNSEVGEAILVLDDDLTVDQGGSALELEAGVYNSAVFVRPVMPAAGEGTNVAPVDASA